MITENTHPEHNDWQKPGGEQSSASESTQLLPQTDVPLAEEQAAILVDQPGHALTEANVDVAEVTQTTSEPDHKTSLPEPHSVLTVDETFAHVSELLTTEQLVPLEGEVLPLFAPEAVPVPVLETETVLPFTDFIEEFRQKEVHLNALVPDQEPHFAAPTVENLEIAAHLEVADEPVQYEETVRTKEASATNSQTEEAQPDLTPPGLATERPVSPLLRPATRLRLPRHGRHRVEEHTKPAEATKPEVETKEESVAPPVETPPSEEPVTRPARRYRFDRPASTTNASLPSTALPKAAPTLEQIRSAEVKEKQPATPVEQKPSSEKAQGTVAAPELPVQPVQKASAPEAEPTSPEVSVPTPPPPPSERRRRNNHERQREKEQAAPPAPIAEVVPPEKETAPVAKIPVEDLPPLEYAELQAANSRRRRRRRMTTTSPVPSSNGAVAAKAIAPEPVLPAPVTPVAPPPLPPTPTATAPNSAPIAPVAPIVVPNYNIVSGYTVSQMNQGNDSAGPFMGPEPSPARGSTFSTAPQVRHTRNEMLRNATSTTHTVKHAESTLMSASAINHLGNIVSQAIQVQTDRMVAELRRANQSPTNISVSLPPFPSNERVGVFVDVANLLYSARTLRMTVDFGKLLDFLRGNRRLVRAQAYCPTSPQPGDDQMFLQ
ncbi:MAG: NYN domain-containing protein, partial [Ktedonobacteraceae bacterium]